MTDEDDFPMQDPLAKWRGEADYLERRRRIAKRLQRRQEQEQATAQAAATTATAFEKRLYEQKEFLIDVCGQALGELAEQLRDEFVKKIDGLEQHLKGTHDLYSRELGVAHSHIQLLQRQLDQLTSKRHGSATGLAAHDSDLPKYDA